MIIKLRELGVDVVIVLHQSGPVEEEVRRLGLDYRILFISKCIEVCREMSLTGLVCYLRSSSSDCSAKRSASISFTQTTGGPMSPGR